MAADFILNQSITTEEPFVKVDVTLRPGRYRFMLVVTDDDGLTSEPTYQDVVILPRGVPGPVDDGIFIRPPIGPDDGIIIPPPLGPDDGTIIRPPLEPDDGLIIRPPIRPDIG